MSQTYKNNNKNQNITAVASQLGLALMTIATLAGLVEMPERPHKALLLAPAYAVAGAEHHQSGSERREREETGPHYTSYNASQRTPGRMGRI